MMIQYYVGFIFLNSNMKFLRYSGSKKHKWKIKKAAKCKL